MTTRLSIYLFFSLFLFMIFCGCVPLRHEYYEPVASGGTSSLSVPAIMSAKDTIEFSFNNTKVRISGTGTGFYLIVFVPKKKVVRFVSNEVEWYLNSNQNKTQVTFYLEYFDESTKQIVQVKPTEALVKNSDRALSLSGPESGIYENSIKLDEVKRDHYFVELPSIAVNGHVFEIPVVKFIKKEGFGVFPINA